jgi:ribosomal protein S17E
MVFVNVKCSSPTLALNRLRLALRTDHHTHYANYRAVLPTFLLFSDNPTNPTATAPSHDNLFSQLTQQVAKMGRVRTKTVKKSAKVIIERYYPKLSLDFETNKRICDEIAIIASKRLRNKIAGYTTHLYVSATELRQWQ